MSENKVVKVSRLVRRGSNDEIVDYIVHLQYADGTFSEHEFPTQEEANGFETSVAVWEVDPVFKRLDKSFINYTVSEGTTNDEYIEAAVSSFLSNNHPDAYEHYLSKRAGYGFGYSSLAYFLDEVLYPIMDAIAPAGTSFSAQVGDGALYGFWLDPESYDTEEGYQADVKAA